ncbi:MAG: sugar phosphate nucleotidyltransferase [Patescibacteria group bacterium]|nr:sugar phosphate nucleotidyltransferase [Patescibacteria group bacterium]
MKGIVLAGGTATRLFPLTATTSKQLLPVYDRQMIFYPLNVLIKADIKEILVIVAPEHSGQYLNLLGSMFEKHGVHVEFCVQKTPRGLADAFIVGENFIDDDDVTMILGDNIFEEDLTPHIKNFKSGGLIFARKVPDPERYGVVKFDKSMKAIEIEEKPEKWISDYAIPGIYIYDSRVIEAAKKAKPSKRDEIEITSLHNWYLEKNELKVATFEGEWLDAGTFDSLLEAGRIVKEKNITENFHPIVNKAIDQFNKELKNKAKNVLESNSL